MPPKAKLHSKHGKLKSLPKFPNIPIMITPAIASTSNDSAGTSNDQADQQFKAEIYWCVQQLEESLSSKKLNSKQTEEALSVLKTLKSPNQPIVKKRQVMRMHFGDYRSKMAAEEKKAKKINNQISFTKKDSAHGKSTFIKKSTILTGDNTFRFNFQPPTDSEPPPNVLNDSEDMKETDDGSEIIIKNDFSKLNLHSGSGFMFNFQVDES